MSKYGNRAEATVGEGELESTVDELHHTALKMQAEIEKRLTRGS